MKRKKMIFGKLTIIDVNYVKPCRILLQFYTFVDFTQTMNLFVMKCIGLVLRILKRLINLIKV